jgi:hypothetical protein
MNPRQSAPAMTASPCARDAIASAAAPRMRGRRVASLLLFLGAVASAAWLRPVLAQSLTEYEIKAAFIYNFAKFVEWPASAFAQPQSRLILCLIGKDVFGAALDTIDHKLAQGHELQVRRQVLLEEVKSCHILFVSESERGNLAPIFRALAGTSVLSISDMDRFAEAGGMIGLYKVDNQVQFAINLDAARDASLQINSQLLKLARIIRRSANEGGK